MTGGLFHHPTIGFSLQVPRSWELVEDAPGVALIVVEPARPGLFRPNVVVTVEPVEPGTGLAEWATAGDEALGQVLHRHILLDDEEVDLHGVPARRTLSSYTSPDDHPVTMEQWALVSGACGYTLTASAWTLEYDVLAEVFEEIVSHFQPDPTFVPA